MNQPGQIVVCQPLGEQRDEARGQVRATVVIEVHREKSDIHRDIAAPEPRVELDAVHDLQAIRFRPLDEHVRQVQVAVPLPDSAAGHPAAEEVGLAPEEVRRGVLNPAKLYRRDDVAGIGGGLIQVLADVVPDCLRRSPLVHPRPGRRLLAVEARQAIGERGQHRLVQLAAPEHPQQHPIIRQPAHLDRVLDDRAVTVELELAADLDHRHHAQVDIPCEPAVEPHLLLAEMVPQFQRGEVQEAEVDRLLDLVDQVASQEDDRDVRLLDVDGLHRIGIGLRPAQVCQQAGHVLPRLVIVIDRHPRAPPRCPYVVTMP
ncbi:hypothetical protein HRbin26_02301 [bacterium HR26]|nr:hypothetical protein HRbin26_02301 [bacterium HR26]